MLNLTSNQKLKSNSFKQVTFFFNSESHITCIKKAKNLEHHRDNDKILDHTVVSRKGDHEIKTALSLVLFPNKFPFKYQWI